MSLRTSDDPFQLEALRATSDRCFSERAFSYTAPHLLNWLLISLSELDSIETFTSKLRTFDLSDQNVNEGYRLFQCFQALV